MESCLHLAVFLVLYPAPELHLAKTFKINTAWVTLMHATRKQPGVMFLAAAAVVSETRNEASLFEKPLRKCFFASFYPVGYTASSAFAFMKEMNADFMGETSTFSWEFPATLSISSVDVPVC